MCVCVRVHVNFVQNVTSLVDVFLRNYVSLCVINIENRFSH